MLEALKEALRIEEQAIPLYARHINNSLFLSGLEKNKRKRAEDVLNILHKESERHGAIFRSLIEKVKVSEKDVY